MIHAAGRDVLLLERADHAGWWQSVTGSRDSLDEPLAETARREVREETGIEAGDALEDWSLSDTYTIYPEYRRRYAPGTITNREHVFGLLVPRDTAVRLAPREHTAWCWMSAADAAAACFSRTNASAIRRLIARA